MLHEGRPEAIVNGHRQYSIDHEKGGVELPAKFRFSIWNENAYEAMKMSAHNLIQEYIE